MALHVECFAPGVIGAGKSGLHIATAGLVFDCDVRTVLLEHEGAARDRLPALRHGRQRLDVQSDGIACVFGECRAVGEHDGNRLADEPHLAIGDHRRLEKGQLRQGKQADRDARHRASDLGRRDDRNHAFERERRPDIQRTYSPARDRTAQDHRVQLLLFPHVVAERAAAAQQTQILDPLHCSSDHRLVHAHDRLHRR